MRNLLTDMVLADTAIHVYMVMSETKDFTRVRRVLEVWEERPSPSLEFSTVSIQIPNDSFTILWELGCHPGTVVSWLSCGSINEAWD